MTSWLHFIGAKYYTMEGFINECMQYGATRRVSLNVLKRMSWGDRVSCVQKPKGVKGVAVFMEFPITRLSGLTEGAVRWIHRKCTKIVKVSDGGEEVDRECGSYETGATYSVEMTLGDLAAALEFLQKRGEDIGKLMVGCSPNQIRVVPKPQPVLRDVPFRMGFRAWDREAFWKTVRRLCHTVPNKRVRVNGQLYMNATPRRTVPGDVQEVRNYQQR